MRQRLAPHRRFALTRNARAPGYAIVLLALFTACTAGTTSKPESPTTPPSYLAAPAGLASLPNYVDTQGGSDAEQVYTAAEVTQLARRFNLIVARKATFTATGWTPTMRKANPDLTLLTYLNGAFSQVAEAPALPDSWFLLDSSGNRILHKVFGTSLMDITNPEWKKYVAEKCVSFVARAASDGCLLDDLGAGNLTASFSSDPIDPSTQLRYTTASWVAATSSLASYVKANVAGDVLVFSNGLNSGEAYFGPARTSRLALATDGSEAEGFLRFDSTPIDKFRAEDLWKKDVEMLVDAARTNRVVLALTKVWVTSTPEQSARWRRYAYSSFLLGTNGAHFFSFSDTEPGKGPGPDPIETMQLGRAKSAYMKIDGVYRRDFERGVVLVNPSTESVTVELEKAMRTLDGQLVASVTLGPHSGEILT